MWRSIWARILSEVFGDGLGADLAGRGTVFLVDEVRKSLDREEERVTSVRLRPGESYSVLVRPPATPAERKLARTQRRLDERDRHLARPSRGQIRAARRLARAQRRLDRRRPGSARHRRARAREAELGARFDRVMRPTRRQVAVRRDLLDVTTRLDASRAANLAKVQRGRRRRPDRERAHVYG
jgi:hypothetical protein